MQQSVDASMTESIVQDLTAFQAATRRSANYSGGAPMLPEAIPHSAGCGGTVHTLRKQLQAEGAEFGGRRLKYLSDRITVDQEKYVVEKGP